MAVRARVLVILPFVAAILQACSGDDTTTPTPDASDGSPGADATGSDAARETSREATVESSTSLDGTSSDGSAADVDATSPPPDASNDTSMACPTPVYTHVSTFGAIFDGWVVAPNSTASLVPATSADGAMTGTLLELDPTVGSPTPGSAKLTIPFSQPGDQLLFAFNSSVPLNLTGTTVTAQIRLDSGLNTSPVNPGQAFIALKSTASYIYAQANPTFLDSSAGFVTLSFAADPPTATTLGYTPCDIREIDIVVQTGNTGTYTTAVVHIDTIAVSAPGVDSGAGDASGDAPSEAASDATEENIGDSPPGDVAVDAAGGG
jgi:hypothetical protein